MKSHFRTDKLLGDMQLFLTTDGHICTVEGFYHPDDSVIANVVYFKDISGDMLIEGTHYIRMFRKPTGEWRSFQEQRKLLLSKKVTYEWSEVFLNKLIIPKCKIVAYTDPYECFSEFCDSCSPDQLKSLQGFFNTIGLSDETRVGIVGSRQVGRFSQDSDLDLIFHSSVTNNLSLWSKITRLSSIPQKSVIDRGRVLPLRLYDDHHNMYCNHFSYKCENEIPKIFSIRSQMGSNVTVKAIICDVVHSLYSPSVIGCKDIVSGEQLKLVFYHGGNKGEFREGQIVKCKCVVVTNSHGSYHNVIEVFEDHESQ